MQTLLRSQRSSEFRRARIARKARGEGANGGVDRRRRVAVRFQMARGYGEDREQVDRSGDACGTEAWIIDHYFAAMEGDAEITLARFRDIGGSSWQYVAWMKGLTSPGYRTLSFWLRQRTHASSTQRRGRVLRVAPGKTRAKIYDVLALPPRDLRPAESPLLLAEIGRALHIRPGCRQCRGNYGGSVGLPPLRTGSGRRCGFRQ